MGLRIVLIAGLAGCDLVFPFADRSVPGDGTGTDGGTPITFVQNNFDFLTSSSGCSVALSGPSAVGALIIATVTFDGASQVSTVADNENNVYTRVFAPRAWSTYHTAMFYTQGLRQAGPITVSFTLDTAVNTLCAAYVDEYAGASAFDQASVNSGSSATSITSNPVTIDRPELIFGHAELDSVVVTVSPGTGFEGRLQSLGNAEEDKFARDPGSYDASFLIDGNTPYVAAVATFK